MLRDDGRLLHTWRHGKAKLDAYLDDYAALANGLISLYEATFDSHRLDEAARLADVMLDHFADAAGGGFFYTADDHEQLIARTKDVTEAAGTKWNFLKFKPGLVGGHCIGVDPYYLTHKAMEVGHYPEVILAGRRINDSMGSYVADQLVLLMTRKGLRVGGAHILVLGLTFKENCPDTKNTRVVDVVGRLREYGAVVEVADPWVGADQAAMLAVAHDQFAGVGPALRDLVGTEGVLYDVKGMLGSEADGTL